MFILVTTVLAFTLVTIPHWVCIWIEAHDR